MSYRLKSDEKVSKGLKRVVTNELTSALEQLAGPRLSDDVIHEVRKSLKKVRAVIQLVGDDIEAGRAERRLRRVGRLLSPLRDADAVLTSTRALCGRQGRPSAKTCAVLREVFGEQKIRVMHGPRAEHAWDEAARALRRVRRSAKDWDWERVGFPELAGAVRRVYRDSRRAMRHARDHDGPVAFHEWRKRVKTLWYALRLVERRTTSRLESLDRLGIWLGDDHNLAVLRSRVARSRRRGRHLTGRAEVQELAEERQQQLRRRALTTGARVFRDPPKAFGRRLRRNIRATL